MNAKDVAIFCAVIGGFVADILLSLFFHVADRLIGVVLVLVGVVAVLFSQSVSNAKQFIGEKLPLWPGKSTLRPFIVKLCGVEAAAIGTMMIGEL